MSKFIKGNPQENIFESNKELRYVDEFKRLIKAEGEERASKIAWALYMVHDPSSSLFNMDMDVKLDNVAKNYLEEPEFDWEKYDYVADALKTHSMGPKKRLYSEYINLFENRKTYLRTLSYEHCTPKEAKEIDALIIASDKLFQSLDKVEKEYLKEVENAGRVHGGKQLSASEQGLI